MKFKTILFESKNGLGIVTINRPQVLNALDMQVVDEIHEVFQHIEKSDGIKCVIITGAGRSFVAGADITQMSTMDRRDGRDMVLKGQKVMNLIENMDKPVIAAINGFAIGGGLELAMACDFRIASDKAKFSQPEINLGIIPGYGGTQRLARLVGVGMAKYLVLSTEMINADEALRIGLVERVVPVDELMSFVEELAYSIIKKSPIGMKMAMKAINVGTKMDISSGIDYEAECYVTAFTSDDRFEGMTAFTEKRDPIFNNK